MSDAARPQWAGQRAMSWVIDEAPVPTALFPVLMVIARRCDENGRGSYQSVPTIAEKTGKSPDQVKRDIRELKKLGLLVEGDADLTRHLPEWKRPAVYDLPLHVSGAKPLKESKNKTGGTSQGGGMDTPGGMDATWWHSTRQGGGMDALGGGGMDAPQTKPLKNKKNNPSLSPREHEQPPAASVPAQRTERETDDEDSQTSEPRTLPHCLLLKNGAPEDQLDFLEDFIASGNNILGNGWWITADRNGTLAGHIADGLNNVDVPENPQRPNRGGRPLPSTADARWELVDRQIRRGKYQPWRPPEDQSEYDKPFSGQIARSPADQRLIDAQPLYDHYKGLEENR